MSLVSGDASFLVAAVNASWTRLVPSPADSTIPKSAGMELKIQNLGAGTVYLLKRTHSALDAPTVALPAATEAGALADAGLVTVLEHAQEIALPAPFLGFPDLLRCSDYYVWTNDAAGGPVRVWPVN